MEVGAVKQAFNNEVIQLKKNLNQAKIQVIHKLTRKAKTLTEKKGPEHLKEKNKKKAESAVKEVLIIKKLKPRDIAKFIITNKSELNKHMNKPTVDNDKACARLLLHKALQQKYKIIKDKFGDIPIKDLLMSRQERLKLKKEAKDAQNNKKKGKGGKVVNSEGAWNVEDVVMGDDRKNIGKEGGSDEGSVDGNSDMESDKDDVSNDGNQDVSDDDETSVTRQVVNDSDESSDAEAAAIENQDSNGGSDEDGDDDIEMEKEVSSESECEENQEIETKNPEHVKPAKQQKSQLKVPKTETTNLDIEEVLINLKPKKKPDKKVKDNKNKNLNEKMLNRKFKKESSDSHTDNKVVDPFFKTATGENYMSLAEPRQPDEFKEIHRQGNRQERRAAMFGRAPVRPRSNKPNFKSGNFNNRNDSNGKFHKFDDRRGKFNDKNCFNDRNSKFNDRDSHFNDRSSNFNGRNNRSSNLNDKNFKFNDRNSNFIDRNSGNSKSNDRNFNNNKAEATEEKLHPSWEAKKKQSGILPYKGKKIVFDET